MSDGRSRLLGAWRLHRYDDRESVGDEWIETYGEGLDGLLVYDGSGWLSVQVTASNGRFDSYFGRFTVIECSEHDGEVIGIVNHEIVASSMPELLTADQARPFRITDRTLILGQTWRRIFTRLY
jgi:hypothetical protein